MEQIEYCCPRCKGSLAGRPDGYRCAACDTAYPVVLGLPDFRVFSDPYLSIADDHRKAARIAERGTTSNFRELVEFYWSITPEEPPAMASRFTGQALAAADRGRHVIAGQARMQNQLAHPDTHLLDLGTRTGGLLLAAAERCDSVIGIDIALRWLIIARKRMEEAGRPAPLVCCCAEFLPFREGAFDIVVAENILEHTAQPQQLIDEAHRVLQPAGVFFAITWNRWAVAPEPHVRLWGVGWLPRRWARRYVEWRRSGVTYEHVRLLSLFEIRRLIGRSPFRRCEFALPAFGPAELANVSANERRILNLYHRVKDWPLFRGLLLIIAPVLHLVCSRVVR